MPSAINVCLGLTLFSLCIGRASDEERTLIEHLLDRQNYNTLIRPVQNLSDTIEVGFELALIQLINLVRICAMP